ncbi:abortive infection family protein [Caulobacter sp. UNC279MFTsu5.1]|uniref:abortive infection family protein n=1 Tax=Caulobacter sp. UNC279MFTsu5.1 TaxID=1502775 RepID=UPI0003AA98FE|nr:abortive infection family protein [Caulobacter sp. UNC279MFTsu5.1]SFK71789.1 Abortive infection C-terminus [Caulobacter sp. UNC279MFTsu5.1]
MKRSPSPAQLKELRHQLASAISDAKAYNVPAICTGLGLHEGDTDEAMRSRYKYAISRVTEVPAADLLSVVRTYLAENEHFALSEALAKIEEASGPTITDLTRKRIIDLYGEFPVCTEQEPIEFFKALWPIATMLEADQIPGISRTLEEAIFQHTVRNYDWDNKDVLKAIGLPAMSQRQFFRFLAASVHPMAQNHERQAVMVGEINEHLKHDGFALKIVKRISGSPVYEVQTAQLGMPNDEAITASLVAFNPTDIGARWQAAQDRRLTDPSGAITLSRTLLEDVCKWILHEAGDTSDADKDELPALYRKLAKAMSLAPDDHTEAIFKQILGGCSAIVEGLGALRNKLSDAHSPGPKRARPMSRPCGTCRRSIWRNGPIPRRDMERATGGG